MISGLLIIVVIGALLPVLAAVEQAKPASATVATPTFVQGAIASTPSGNATSTSTNAFASNTTVGNVIVAMGTWDYAATSTTPTCSDTTGDTFASLSTQIDTSHNQGLVICWAPVTVSGKPTVKMTYSTSLCCRQIGAYEFSGVNTTSPLDVSTGNFANGTTTANAITTNSMTTTATNDLIVVKVPAVPPD